MKRITEVEGLPAFGSEGLPVSWATIGNDGTVRTAGMVGFTPEGRLIEGGIEAETPQTMENLIRVLGAAGVDLEDVLDAKVFITKEEYAPVVNRTFRNFFEAGRFPARTTAVTGLLMGASVEMSFTA